MSNTSTKQRLPGLLDEPPINLYPSLAKRTGVNKAAILQEVHFICTMKRRDQDERTFRDGRHWVYNTIEQWVEIYFPWMSISAAKKNFRELEIVGILLSMESEHDKRSKWYAINYDRWPSWFEETADDDKERIKNVRNVYVRKGQNVPLTTRNRDKICPDIADKIKPESMPDRDKIEPVPHIYKDSEDSTTEDSFSTEDSTTTEDRVIVGVVESDFLIQVRSELKSIHLTDERIEQLLAWGTIHALAALWYVRDQKNVTNPAGLMVHLMHNEGPPENYLEKASYAVELQTLNEYEISARMNSVDLEILTSEADRMAAEALEHIEQPETVAPVADDNTAGHEPPDRSERPEADESTEMPAPEIAPEPEPLTARQIFDRAVGKLDNFGRLYYLLRGATVESDGDQITLGYLYRDRIEQHEDKLRAAIKAVADRPVAVGFQYEKDSRPRPALVGGGL